MEQMNTSTFAKTKEELALRKIKAHIGQATQASSNRDEMQELLAFVRARMGIDSRGEPHCQYPEKGGIPSLPEFFIKGINCNPDTKKVTIFGNVGCDGCFEIIRCEESGCITANGAAVRFVVCDHAQTSRWHMHIEYLG